MVTATIFDPTECAAGGARRVTVTFHATPVPADADVLQFDWAYSDALSEFGATDTVSHAFATPGLATGTVTLIPASSACAVRIIAGVQ